MPFNVPISVPVAGSAFIPSNTTPPIIIPNLTVNGPLGLVGNTVDINTVFEVNQTSPGVSMTIPSPTKASASHSIIIVSSPTSTTPLDVYGTSVDPGKAAQFVWDGVRWIVVGTAAATTATGVIVGSSNDYSTLPLTSTVGNYSILTADVVGTGTPTSPQYPKGIYLWNGTSYVLSSSFGSASLGGLYKGSSATFATLPVAVLAFDWALLSADNVGTGTILSPQYPRGIYRWDGTGYGLETSLSAAPIAGVYKGVGATFATLPAANLAGDWVALSADDIGTGTIAVPQYVRGIYKWDGTAYVLDLSLVNVSSGVYLGAGGTFGGLPGAVNVGDWAGLTTDDIGTGSASLPQYPRGIYRWDGTAYVLSARFDVDSVKVTGRYVGSAATFVTLPTSSLTIGAAVSGDWVALSADDVGTGTVAIPQYTAGVYVYDGTNYVFAFKLDILTVQTMTGATALVAGTGGAVPVPAIGDNTKVLYGDATWKSIASFKGVFADWTALPTVNIVGDLATTDADNVGTGTVVVPQHPRGLYQFDGVNWLPVGQFDTVQGTFRGSASTFVALVAIPSLTDRDFAFLTADDGVNVRGIYSKVAGAYSLALAIPSPEPVARLTATNTALIPGTYDISTSGGAFDLTLVDTVGRWVFHNTDRSLGTNNVTLLSGGVKSFTEENGLQDVEDFIYDLPGQTFSVIHSEPGSVYRVAFETMPASSAVSTPLIVATGGRGLTNVLAIASLASPTWIEWTSLDLLSGSGATLNTATGEITLPAGTYSVTGQLGAPNGGGRTSFSWFVNGVRGGTIGGSFSPTDSGGLQQIAGPATHTFALAATGIIRMGVILSTNSLQFGGGLDQPNAFPTFELVQLPGSMVVDPGLITPTPLASAELRYAAAGGPNGGGTFSGNGIQQATWFTPGTGAQLFQANLVATATLTSDFVVSSASVLTCNKTGVYAIRAEIGWDSVPGSLEPYLQIIVGGVVVGVKTVSTSGAATDCPEISWTGPITAGQGISICHGGTSSVSGGAISSYHLSVREQPASTVIDPGAITVNDQSTTGYMDIGGMRQAWGKTLSDNDDGQTITFGVTFASPPVVTATTDVGSGASAAYGGAIKTITTTSFIYNRDDTIQNPDNAFVNWFAVGRKP